MAEHTPGPWHVGIGNGEGYIFGPEGTRRAPTGLYAIAVINGRTAEDQANARLIAAAPDLLAALGAILSEVSGHYDGWARDAVSVIVIRELAKAAIVKTK